MSHLNRSNIDPGLISPDPLLSPQPASSKWRIAYLFITILAAIAIVLPVLEKTRAHSQHDQGKRQKLRNFDAQITSNAQELITDGRTTFRFDTFGDEAFWGDTLQLHKAIEGANFGGVGPGISPNTALNLGLKVDVDALPQPVQEDIRKGRVNLDDPATTLTLLKLNAVVGVKGTFNGNTLGSVGLTCAICHSRSTSHWPLVSVIDLMGGPTVISTPERLLPLLPI